MRKLKIYFKITPNPKSQYATVIYGKDKRIINRDWCALQVYDNSEIVQFWIDNHSKIEDMKIEKL